MKCCEEYAALLDLFVDGELPPEEMAQIQAHLEGCPGCQAYVDDALAIRAGCSDIIESTAVPEGFAEGVMERIRQDAERGVKAVELRRRSVRRWTGTLAALAACCALVIAVRTGPGGLNRGGSAAVTAGGSVPAACDMAADNEPGIAAQAAETARAEGEAAPENGQEETEGRMETRMSAMDQKDPERGAGETAGPSEDGDLPLAVCPTLAPPEVSDATAKEREAALRLTAEEAGSSLDAFVPVWETDGERGYELSAEAYAALLEALGRQGEAAAEPVLVVVTGPFA